MNQPFPMLFVGDAEQREFRVAATWLQERGARLANDIPAALAALNDSDFCPAVIVLAQRDSQPFAAEQIEKLRQAAPLARIIRLLGPWLEGESRSGKPIPATLRAGWEQWPGKIQQPTSSAMNNYESEHVVSAPLWSLPLTATEDDRLLALLGGNISANSFSDQAEATISVVAPTFLIAVHAQHRETAHTLCDICHARGWKSLWLRTLPVETPISVNAVLFDLAANTAQELDQIRAMKAIVGDAPLIALAGFPRSEDISQLRAAGAAAVISKPFLTGDLIWQTEQLFLSPSAV
jgi:CheY-like chemotaxis protein